jgi:peptide/nickel transport system substrate-binding protein
MFKKLISVILIALMIISITACGKKASETGVETVETAAQKGDATTPTVEELNRTPAGEITIGNTTEISGDFVPYWQNNASDFDIYKLTSNAYSTVDMTVESEYVVDNTVVKDYKITENQDGSKTYTWTINEGLVWNDGTPITAADYAASVMLWSSPVIAEMGAENIYGYYFKGFKEFSEGKTKEFPGVNLISEDTFAITIAAENLPFFYELALSSVAPTKLSFWTDETVTIKDDGKGCYFSDNFTKAAYEKKLNAARGAVPRVTCGPYTLTSFDTATKTAVLDINSLYKGNYEGKKPSIKTVIIKKVTEETSLDELSTGSVDLLVKMTTGHQINTGLDLVETGKFAYTAYDRSGYGKLQFACDFGPTQFIEVRQAIAFVTFVLPHMYSWPSFETPKL